MLMLLPATLRAQAYDTVAAGTSSSQHVPFYLFNAPYAQWTQSIYTADRLTALQGKTLTAFTYHTAISTFTPTPGTWTVSLAITTNSDLELGKDDTPCTQVFSGTPTFADGNLTFTFDTPFDYEGGNLLVYFDHQAGTTTEQQSTTFWSTVVSGNRPSRYACNNSHVTSAYSGEGAIAAYLPTIYVSTSDGNEPDDSCTVTVSAAEPFYETFVDTWTDGVPNECWANSHVAGAGVNRWSKSYQGHDDMYGAKMAYDFFASDNTAKANLVTPRLSIPQGGAYNVSLWLKRVSYSSVRSDAGVRVFVNATPDTIGATLLFFAPQHISVAPTVSEAGWYYYEGTIPEAGEQYVIVQGVDQAMSDIWIDELKVAIGTTSCDNPTELEWDGNAVSWQAGNATQWQVRDGETLSIVDTPFYSDPTWAPASMHDVYIRSICDEGDTLEWRGPVSFSMPCEIIYLDGTNSYYENFDALTTSGSLPSCWQTSHVSGPGSALWGSYSAVSAHSGNRLMNLPDMAATTLTDLVMPTVNIVADSSYELSLWIYRNNGTKPNEGVRAWASSTTDTTGGTPLFHARRCAGQEPVVDTFGWYEYTGVIPMSGQVHIVLQGISEYGQQTWIDDVSIRPVSAIPPTPIDTTAADTTTVDPTPIDTTVTDTTVIDPTPIDTTTVDTTVTTLVDATIAANDIRYWVGNGPNEVILAVNWVDTALAWGYRFQSASTTVQEVMDSLSAADPRLSYSGTGMLDDIVFTENGTSHQALQAGWWMSTLNGNSNASIGLATELHNGDLFKWGDYTIGTTVDPETWAMVFTDSIYAVSAPDTTTTDTTDTTDTTGISYPLSTLNSPLSVYPNPAVNTLYVSVQEAAEAVLFDMAGRRVMVIGLRKGGNEIDISSLKSGVYMLRCNGSAAKIVKQ